MARIPLIDQASAEPETSRLLEEIAGQRGRPFNVYRMLAHSPGTLERIYGLASHLWTSSVLGAQVLELVILRVADLTDSAYERARHLPLARRAGVSEEQIAALRVWSSSPADLFSAAERAALALTDEVVAQVEAGAATVASVREHFGERGTVELIVLVGLYQMVAGLLRSLAVDGEPGDEAPVDL